MSGDVLTHVTGIRRLVVAATKRKDPNQSNSRSFTQIEPSLMCNRRQIGIPTAAITQKGMLSQKIHLHVTFSAKAPPMTVQESESALLLLNDWGCRESFARSGDERSSSSQL